MYNFFIKNEQFENNKVRIIGDDFNHIKNVLRLKCGENINISILESEKKFLVEIEEITSNEIICKVLNEIESCETDNLNINIIQGLPKSDKMELIIQKCTELGVKEITPLNLNRCVVKINSNDAEKKFRRWQAIAEAAAKQSGRNVITKINPIVFNIKELESFLNEYDLVLVAYENEKKVSLKEVLKEVKFKNLQEEMFFAASNNFDKNLKINSDKKMKIGIIIGPEGGFEECEIEYLKSIGVKSISLGKRILRTETVAIVLSSLLMYELGDFGEC